MRAGLWGGGVEGVCGGRRGLQSTCCSRSQGHQQAPVLRRKLPILCLCVFAGVCSQCVVGVYGLAHDDDLVLSVLNMALTQRKPQDVIYYSEQGG